MKTRLIDKIIFYLLTALLILILIIFGFAAFSSFLNYYWGAG
jgi:hypothetical protein